MKKIFITGGAGYVGNVLVPQLLEENYSVTVYDILFFGKSTLPNNNKNLKVIKGDIRDIEKIKLCMSNHDTVLHLACISNDPSFALDENLSKTINYDCFEDIVKSAKQVGVRRFIYCSSSSVYGVAKTSEVTETTPLVPLTLYNKYKGLCEPLLFKHIDDNFTGVAIRPATVCGYSPRMRLDLSVNIFTNYAINKNKITVFGGEQERPNLHIQDMCNAYKLFINAPDEKIQGEVFNIGYQNYSILKLAQIVKQVVEKEYPNKRDINMEITKSNDIRSYRINSDKVKRILNFKASYSIENAVQDICSAFKSGKLKNTFEDINFYNVKQIKNFSK